MPFGCQAVGTSLGKEHPDISLEAPAAIPASLSCERPGFCCYWAFPFGDIFSIMAQGTDHYFYSCHPHHIRTDPNPCLACGSTTGFCQEPNGQANNVGRMWGVTVPGTALKHGERSLWTNPLPESQKDDSERHSVLFSESPMQDRGPVLLSEWTS